MNEIDDLNLSARDLQLFLAVLDTGSVTESAARLGLTQSAVSHGLTRLRAATGDALFVKSGRGIVATIHALRLGGQARDLLRALRGFGRDVEAFDPSRWRASITVAANDFQRELLLPQWFAALRVLSPHVHWSVVHSGVPSAAWLRDDRVQMLITPRPPEATDIVQTRLFVDEYVVVYDPAKREAPTTPKAFSVADHATVVYEGGRVLEVDAHWRAHGVARNVVLSVPGFAALPGFVRGSHLLTVMPRLLAARYAPALAYAPLPVKAPPLPMYAVWHLRDQQDPAHRWLRAQLLASVAQVLDANPQSGARGQKKGGRSLP
jgi:DNA-binding transcriptional LysR family regulator